MKPAHKPLLWGAAAVAAGLLVLLAVRGIRSGDAPAMPSGPAAPAQAAMAIASATAPAADDTPPWLQPGAASAGTLPARTGTAAAPAASPVEIEKSIAHIRQQSAQNIRSVDDLLAQLDALEKSGKAPPDVRLDALRNNLVVAKQAQQLARELAESTQQPDSPQRRQRHAEIIAELEQLQGRLRYDVGAAPTGGRQAQ